MRRFACLMAFALACSSASAGEPSLDRYLAPLPKGAKARLGMRIDTANNVTYAASAESPDGKLLATVIDRNVLVWDADGRVLQNFVAHKFKLRNVAFSGNDTLLTQGHDDGFRDKIKSWNPRTGELKHTLDVQENWAGSAFSRDGKLLALTTVGGPNILRVWDLVAGKELFSDKEHYPGIFFSHDDKHVISSRQDRIAQGQYDTIVTFRAARTGEVVRKVVLKDQQTSITDVSPDGKYLVGHTHMPHAIQDKWRTRMQLFDAESGKVIRVFLEQRSGDLKSAVFSPDGKLVSGVDHNVRAIGVWNVESGKKVWTFPNDMSFFNYPRFSRSRHALINTTSGGRVFVHNLQDGTTRDFNPTLRGHVGCLAFSADGKRLAAASHLSQIDVWDIAAGTPLHRFEMTPPYDGNGKTNHAYAIKMAFAPDGKHLLTQEVDQTVRLWDPRRRSEVQSFRAAGHVWGFTDNGKHLLWTAMRLDLLHRMHNAPKQVVAGDFDFWVGCARWAAVAYACPEVRQFSARAYVSADLKGEFPPPQRFDVFGEPRGAAATPFGLSPDGSVLAEWIMRLAGNPSSGLGTYWVRSGFRLSDVVTGKEIIRTPPTEDAMLIFAPDSRSFVSLTRSGDDKYGLRLCETRTGRERIKITNEAGQYSSFAFSRDGRWFVFINTQNAIEIFDLALGKSAAEIAQKEHNPRFAFSPDGSLLASGGNTGTILLWDMNALVKRDFNESAWSAEDKAGLWNDLAQTDPAKAFAAIMRLKRSPAASVALIRDRLQWRVANQEIEKLIARLGSDDFATRKKAHDTIEQLGERARPALSIALKETKSLEDRRRVEALHALLERPFTTPIGLRLLRAIEVLDALRTPEAATLLREIATDAPADEPLGREVARALERLSSSSK